MTAPHLLPGFVRRWFTRYRRVQLFIIACAVVAGMQAWLLSAKIEAIDAKHFERVAVALRTDPAWRIGYVVLYHGAVLVKTRNQEAVAGSRVMHESEVVDTGADNEVRAIMVRELDRVPMKSALELGLYLALVGWVFYGARWFTAWFVGDSDRWWRWFGASALAWIAGWSAAASPLLIGGYGTPLFSSWMGPGALSWSGGYPISLGSGLTVSYRGVVESIAIYPQLFVGPLLNVVTRHMPKSRDGFGFWLAGAILYGVIGGVHGLFRDRG